MRALWDKVPPVSRLLRYYLLFSLLDVFLFCSFYGIPLALCLPGPVSVPLALCTVLFADSDSARAYAALFVLFFSVFFLLAVFFALFLKKPLPLLVAVAVDPLARMVLLTVLRQAEIETVSSGDLLIALGILLSSLYTLLLWRQFLRKHPTYRQSARPTFGA